MLCTYYFYLLVFLCFIYFFILFLLLPIILYSLNSSLTKYSHFFKILYQNAKLLFCSLPLKLTLKGLGDKVSTKYSKNKKIIIKRATTSSEHFRPFWKLCIALNFIFNLVAMQLLWEVWRFISYFEVINQIEIWCCRFNVCKFFFPFCPSLTPSHLTLSQISHPGSFHTQ